MQIIHGRGCVYAMEYHIVWCVKYRRKVIDNIVETHLKIILEQYADDSAFRIGEFNTDRDRVHLLISATPHTNLPGIIQGMKGVTARKLFIRCPWIKNSLWGGHLWSPSYFIATVSENTESQIRDYIKTQKET